MGQISSRAVDTGGFWPHPPVGAQYLPPHLSHRFKNIAKELVNDEVSETVLRVAERGPPKPNTYPHDTTKDDYAYKYMSSNWWASGFFPGSLWLLYERSLHSPQSMSSSDILALALQWQKGMEDQQYNTGTHDLGFMMMPAFYRDYTLRGSESSKDIIVTAAHSLSTRWSETVQCIRSWDSMVTSRLNFTDKNEDFLVIIDNMMNLELLYRGSEITGNPEFARRATHHAKTTLKHHVRPDASTYHLVDYDPHNGDVKGRYTVQGYADNSTWARGQAWGVYGYTTAFKFTKDPEFLVAAMRLGRTFVDRVQQTAHGTGNVYWDFDAPRPPFVRDMSAAMAACSGLLELYSLTGDIEFLPAVAQILEYATHNAKAPKGGDTILVGSTVNNNPDNAHPNFETGLVYADYYFLEIGNRLMELKLV